MTEIEKLKRAKLYISSLAEGVDPLSGDELPGDTVLNNVRLSRCFYYVAEVLDRVIANGGEVRQRGGRSTFCITPEEKQTLTTADGPVTITEFTKRINEAVCTDGRGKLSYKTIQSWLIGKGFLQTLTSLNGRARTAICEQSGLIGIYSETRNGAAGSYDVVLYSPEAQQFLLDNLDDILA